MSLRGNYDNLTLDQLRELKQRLVGSETAVESEIDKQIAIKMIEEQADQLRTNESNENTDPCSSKEYLEEKFGNGNVITVESVSEYVQEVRNITSSYDSTVFSRGVSNFKHDLKPSLFRFFSNAKINIYDEMFESFKQNSVYHYKQLLHMSDYEISAFAQHYGFPTNLLDFTTGHLLSLLFSVEENEFDDSVVYFVDSLSYNFKVTNREKIIDSKEATSHISETRPFFSTVPINNERIHTQKGVFLYFPYKSLTAETQEGREQIVKQLNEDLKKHGLVKIILIAKEFKESMLEELFDLGIDFERIYPGIESYIKTIKYKYKEVK